MSTTWITSQPIQPIKNQRWVHREWRHSLTSQSRRACEQTASDEWPNQPIRKRLWVHREWRHGQISQSGNACEYTASDVMAESANQEYKFLLPHNIANLSNMRSYPISLWSYLYMALSLCVVQNLLWCLFDVTCSHHGYTCFRSAQSLTSTLLSSKRVDQFVKTL